MGRLVLGVLGGGALMQGKLVVEGGRYVSRRVSEFIRINQN